jgi:protein O-mannosyl-transferase
MGRKSRLKVTTERQATQPAAPPRRAGAPVRPLPRASLAIAVALAILTLAVYFQTRNHQFINFDDDRYVTNNVVVQRGLTAEGIKWAVTNMDVNWHPTTWITYLLDVEFFGVSSRATHLVNVAFHVANTILLFLLLARITGAVGRSAFVAALFAIHPLHVESVAWISERKDVVSTLFLLITLWLYVSWTRSSKSGTYVLAVVAFALGLMAKQMLVTLPFVLLLVDYWPLQRLDLRSTALLTKRVVEKIPFFIVTALGVVMSLIGQKAIGAVSEAVPLGTRLANALSSYGRYLWKTLVPTGLAIPYPFESVNSGIVLISVLVLLGISGLAFVLREKHRYLFTGWFWFVGTLVPVIGIIQIGAQSMADRYTYIPHIGLFIAVVWLIAELAKTRTAQQAAAAIGIVAVIAFAVLAHQQTARWRDSETLFTHALATTENNFTAHLQLASVLKERAEYEQALENYRAANRLRAGSSEAKEGLAQTLIEMAKLDRARGDDQAAAQKLQEAQSVSPDDKTRAAIAMAGNDPAKAIELFSAQVAQAEGADARAKAHNDLGAALASAGRDEEAIAEYRKAIELAPRQYDARMNLGALLSRLERNDAAVVEFEAAASIQPQSAEPQVYLALAYQLMGRFDQALAAARRAYAIDPKASNTRLTTAVRMPYKDTNFQEYIAFLERKAAGG